MKNRILVTTFSIVSFVSLVSSAKSEKLYGVTDFRELISFDSASPGTIIDSVTISGLSDQFEGIAGIDFRPATGELYALGNAPGSQYRLYKLNLATGLASQVGTAVQTFRSSANGFGFDFNPVVDRIRVVNNAGQNVRLNPNDATLTADSTLAYAAGDPNAGTTPFVSAAAYTNNFAGAMTTTLYDLESAASQLVTQSPPNNGALNSVAPISLTLGNREHFDISGVTGTAFISQSLFNASTSSFISTLYQINLATGATTNLGEIGSGLGLRGLSAATVPEPGTYALLGGGALFLAFCRRRKSGASALSGK